VLGVVAVAGRPVPHRLLAKVAGLDDAHLDAPLRAGVTHQLLVIRPGEGSYDLRHALLREVIDTDLLPGERTRLHAAFARVLAELPELANASPAVATAELAAHWDAGGEPAQALAARVRAGLAAEHARAFAEATRHYQRALELWERVPEPSQAAGLDLVDLLTRAAEAVAFSGAAQRAVELVEDALGRVDADAEPVRAAELLADLGDYRRVAGDEVGALAAFERAERLVTGAPPSAGHARVLARHARALTLSFQNRKAIPYCEEAIAVARAVGAKAEEAHALTTLGICLADLGELDRSIALHLEARRIAEQVGDAETVVRTYVSLTYALTLAGRDRDALDDARAGYQRARELGLERAAGSYVAGNLALSLLDTGRWAECERFTRELLAGDSWGTFTLHEVRSVLFTRRGDFAAARGHADLTLRLSPPYFEDWAKLRLAELALWEGRDDEAVEAVAEGSAGSRNEIPTGIFLSGPAPGTRLRCGWRPTGPSGQPPGGRPRSSPRSGS
jgi:tetratricopeptide (TPR) repeat protein